MNAPMKSLVYFGAVLLTLNPCFADAQRGAYLAKIMDCGGCHTPGQMKGQPDHSRALAGGDVGFKLPGLGIFYPPNLTADKETGLGKWSADQIQAAITKGVRPDGRQLAPIMPYHSYSALTDADASDLVSYIQSLAPINNAVPAPLAEHAKAPLPYLAVTGP
jgi:mono/diheme cytochrome c family protein